jgi:hypothetical protein
VVNANSPLGAVYPSNLVFIYLVPAERQLQFDLLYVAVDNLNMLVLAPGGAPGRLTLWTVPALEKLRGLFL